MKWMNNPKYFVFACSQKKLLFTEADIQSSQPINYEYFPELQQNTSNIDKYKPITLPLEA